MSCFVMEPRALACIALSVEKLLNMGYEAWGFEAPSGLYDALRDSCADEWDFYDSERIYSRLYELNARAYAERYKEQEDATLPNVDFSRLNIWERPDYNGHYIIKPWHYRLQKLIDCYNYQTDEGSARKDPLKKAMDELSRVLCAFIVRNAADYDAAPWGKF